MKVKEAPEKIYLFENPVTETPDDRWLTHRSCDSDIEYIRKDVLFKRAKEWFLVSGIDSFCEDFLNYISYDR